MEIDVERFSFAGDVHLGYEREMRVRFKVSQDVAMTLARDMGYQTLICGEVRWKVAVRLDSIQEEFDYQRSRRERYGLLHPCKWTVEADVLSEDGVFKATKGDPTP